MSRSLAERAEQLGDAASDKAGKRKRSKGRAAAA